MGKFAKVITTVFLVACLFPAEIVQASDVSELYSLYNEECTSTLPEEITSTVTSYNNAKKYVSMYTYVINSEYDTSTLVNELTSINEELVDIEYKLIGGYSVCEADMLVLESRYSDLLERKDDIEKSLKSYSVDITSLDVNTVPTYSEYKDAVKKKNDYVSKREIGDLENLKIPVQSEALLVYNSDDYTTYRVIDNTGVLSMFNGVVEKVYVDDFYGLTVIVDNYNGVKSYFCNLEYTDVAAGDTVYQNQRIGYVLGSKAVFRLSLAETFVDCSILFEEEI